MGGQGPANMPGVSGFFSQTGLGASQYAPQVQTMEALTPEQQQLLATLTGQITGQIGQGVGIDPSALQTGGFQAVQDMLAGGAPGAGGAQTALQQILGFDPATSQTAQLGVTPTGQATVAGPTWPPQGQPGAGGPGPTPEYLAQKQAYIQQHGQPDLAPGDMRGAGPAGGVAPGQPQYRGPTGTALADVIGPTAGGRDPEGAQRYWKEALVDPSMDLWGDIKAKTMEPFAGMGGMRSGEAMRAMGRAGKEFTTGLTGQLADILYKGEEAARGREFTGQESYAGRAGGAQEAMLGREFAGGESYAGRQATGREAELGRQFGAGESWATRLQAAGESELGREFAGGESFRQTMGGMEQGQLQALMAIPGMSQMMTQTEMAPIQQALQAGGQQFDIGQMGEAWNNPWLAALGPALGTGAFEQMGLPAWEQQGVWGQIMGK